MNFAHLYKSAAETNVKLVTTDDKLGKSKRQKMKSNFVIPNTEEETENIADENQPSNNVTKKARKKDKAKSSQVNNNSEIVMNTEMGEKKSKKRNKSVSFMLDDKEEVAVKKTKSDITATHKQSTIANENNTKKPKNNKNIYAGVDNEDAEMNKRDNVSNHIEKVNKLKRNMSEKLDNGVNYPKEKKINKKTKKNVKGKESGDSNTVNLNEKNKTQDTNENKKKIKQFIEVKTDIGTTDEGPSVEIKKSKKKKQLTKAQNNETQINPGKSNKNENKPEVITGSLENLTIGDNNHTLSNLLNEMTVVDKKKQKKNKTKKKNDKQPAIESAEGDNEGGKEKEKWQKKRWNKGKKGDTDGLHPVNVDDLPISIILSYKKLLVEHFAHCGTVRRVGIAQIYPSESTKPVFNTTIYFDTAADALKALEEDNTSLVGSTIRVLRPFPAEERTAVVHTYGPLSKQVISTLFSNVGQIQRIRHLVKGKKSMSTAFVELDKPEAVERAIKMAEEVRIGGKRVHVSKYQVQHKIKRDKKKHKTTDKIDTEPAVNGDSDHSID